MEYEVYYFNNSHEAINKIKEDTSNLIVCISQLQNTDSLLITQLIRKLYLDVELPVLFLAEKFDYNFYRKFILSFGSDFLLLNTELNEIITSIEYHFQKMKKINADNRNSSKKNVHDLLDELLQNGKLNHYKNKSLIFTEGNYPQYLYYVNKGRLKGYKTSDNGKELIIQLYGKGDFIGYMDLFGEDIYRFTAQAMTESELLLIPKNEFYHLVKSNFTFAYETVRVLAKHNNQKSERMLELAYNSLRKRVANGLLLLQKKFNKSTSDNSTNFSIKITREELANLCGTTTESLIRTLSDFKDERLIFINGKEIEIRELSKLKAMIN